MIIPVVYVAGPYRAHTRERVELNIAAAKHVGALAIAKGWMPLIPHANTAGFEHLTQADDDFFLRGTLELMRRCDAVVLCPGWVASIGTRKEIEIAKSIGTPVYTSEAVLPYAKEFARVEYNRQILANG